MKSSAILQLLAETRPGRCGMCDGKLPPGRRKFCGSPDCKRGFERLYSADRQALGEKR